jgi:dihydroorotate dehydrogenase
MTTEPKPHEIATFNKVIIGAPFGNYLSTPGVTSTVGTYTLKNRAGFMRWYLFWRILRTLRYHRGLGWTNKLGLPNPGIEHARHKAARNPAWIKDKILSIHGFVDTEWYQLLDHVKWIKPAAVELNISCPNVGHLSVPADLFTRAIEVTGVPVIVKLPPVRWEETFEAALAAGVHFFHCTNTLPVPAGGLSGKPLKQVSLEVCRRVKTRAPHVSVIGGGGITGPDDVEDYWKAGAGSFSVASALLNPLHLLPLWPFRDAFLFDLVARADLLWMKAHGLVSPER